jgi:hypothetical protein
MRSPGSTKLLITFSEGIYATGGGALDIPDFTYVDADSGRTVIAVDHVAGSNTAVLTLSSPLNSSNDFGIDLVQVSGIDEYGNAIETNDITLSLGGSCPSGQVVFDLNEPASSSSILDTQGFIPGVVSNPVSAIPGDGSFHGDGANNFITFDSNMGCLLASQEATVEVRVKPSGIDVAPYITRILARDSGGNYQLSVWRGDSALYPAFTPPAGVASIAFWVRPVNIHGGLAWKPVLTDYTQYPIVSDHWYRVKVVWNSNKAGGTADQPYVQADIFLDDEGTDGAGSGENWAGYRNATNANQTYVDATRQLYTGDEITAVNGPFAIGVNINNHANNLFNGLVDWVSWQGVADYTGVDDPPN